MLDKFYMGAVYNYNNKIIYCGPFEYEEKDMEIVNEDGEKACPLYLPETRGKLYIRWPKEEMPNVQFYYFDLQNKEFVPPERCESIPIIDLVSIPVATNFNDIKLYFSTLKEFQVRFNSIEVNNG